MPTSLLVRYGVMAEVARFDAAEGDTFGPGAAVIVRTQRGEELGHVVGPAIAPAGSDKASEGESVLLRHASGADHETAAARRAECEAEFAAWQARIREWGVDLELIDLERTLDGGKLVLYVLNDRGPETTKLALRAAAAGFGVIEVQPVGPEGLIHAASGGGGCGNCSRHK